VGLTVVLPSCADCREIWDTQGLCRHVIGLLFLFMCVCVCVCFFMVVNLLVYILQHQGMHKVKNTVGVQSSVPDQDP